MKKLLFHILLLILVFYQGNVFSQETKTRAFFSLSCHEKIWVATHPFVAGKAWKITSYAKAVSDSLKNDSILDGNDNGGKVDAFRHAFWMASLSQQIRWKKAYRLGKAHERKNKADYRKNRYEEGALPDAISIKMDLLNNSVGINIGRQYPDLAYPNLKHLIINRIAEGELWIIKSTKTGDYLDEENNVLEKSDYEGKWENEKCLVKSDYHY